MISIPLLDDYFNQQIKIPTNFFCVPTHWGSISQESFGQDWLKAINPTKATT